jgi:hypothetical protein
VLQVLIQANGDELQGKLLAQQFVQKTTADHNEWHTGCRGVTDIVEVDASHEVQNLNTVIDV